MTMFRYLVALAGLMLFALACSEPVEPPAGSPDISEPAAPALLMPIPTDSFATQEPAVKSNPTPTPPEPTAIPASPAATPTPARPVPTPSPELPDGYVILADAKYLEETNQEAGRALRSLTWVADGVIESEEYATEFLIYSAIDRENLFYDLMDTLWLEAGNIEELTRALESLEQLADFDLEAAESILLMPFLDTLEPADLVALDSLSRLTDDEDAFWQVMDDEDISDGIDDEEAKLVAILGGVNEYDPGLVATLLDFSRITVEQRTIELPLAGLVTLAIIRTGPGSARSMEILEDSVRNIEDFMGEPFPQRYVALLFEGLSEDFTEGINDGTYMAILVDYDANQVSDELDSSPGMIIAHEVAHYYWRNGRNWLVEGASEFTAAISEAVRVDRRSDLTAFPPCSFVETVSDLEDRDYGPEDPISNCEYSLGSRLFLDLYFNLDDADFRRGFRDLYLAARETPVEEDNPDSGAGIKELRIAFEENADPDTVDAVTARWYEGSGPYDNYHLDTRPVTAALPTIGGQIDRAYLVLGQGDKPVTSLSAAEAKEGLWLMLEYSHDYAGPPQELVIEVIQYYEDGFPYEEFITSLAVDSANAGGVDIYQVGQTLGDEWAPGIYWVYLYHEGEKVAEVAFEVAQ